MIIAIGIHSTARLQVDANVDPKSTGSEKLLNLMR